jgi:hypothetical protein
MRKSIAWLLYHGGDQWCSRVMQHPRLADSEWPYAVYSRLMAWSESIQGAGPGPWKPNAEKIDETD